MADKKQKQKPRKIDRQLTKPKNNKMRVKCDQNAEKGSAKRPWRMEGMVYPAPKRKSQTNEMTNSSHPLPAHTQKP